MWHLLHKEYHIHYICGQVCTRLLHCLYTLHIAQARPTMPCITLVILLKMHCTCICGTNKDHCMRNTFKVELLKYQFSNTKSFIHKLVLAYISVSLHFQNFKATIDRVAFYVDLLLVQSLGIIVFTYFSFGAHRMELSLFIMCMAIHFVPALHISL